MAGNFFNKKSKFSKVDNLGWSSTVEKDEGRVVNKDGTFNVIRKGEQYHIYHLLISMSWIKFFGLTLLSFTLLNGVFSLLYLAAGTENIAGFESNGFILDIVNLFHFSVQTMTTVGYGFMHPTGVLTGIIASFEALIGLLSFALISGLMYGRFSNPKAEIRYAKEMLLTMVNGKPTLQARVANKLSHDLFDIQATVLMLHDETDKAGKTIKRYKTLKLEIDHISFLPMNWTITHFIDEKSPLNGLVKEDLEMQNAEFLVLITAFDDSFSQLVHSRASYLSSEILYDVKYQKTYYVNENGCRVFDLDLLDEIVEEDNEGK